VKKKSRAFLSLFMAFFLVVLLNSCKNQPENKLAPYRWLLGTWEKKDGQFLSVERWEMGISESGDSVMLGWNWQTEGKDTLFQEKLSIRVISDSIFYVAMPEGSLPTKFFIKHTDERAFVAINPRHDFPSEISYDSPGPSTLNAMVSGRIRDHHREIKFNWVKKESI
jgi:hypothetical protein